jgi:excisionase family DNA binding protein
MTDDYRLLTVEEAARLLGVRWTYVRDLIETGQLRHVRVGTRYRVPASALRDLGAPVPTGAPVGAPVVRAAGGGTGGHRRTPGIVTAFETPGRDGGR